MIVLSPAATSQTFKVIPRFEPTGNVDVTFYSKSQNKQTHNFNYAATYADGYLTIVNTFSPVLVNNTPYTVEVKDGEELCWRGRCFVTDQTNLPKYTLNDGAYDEPVQSDNSFVIV